MAHVLLVVPNETLRAALRALLVARGGHTVRGVATGDAAVAALVADPRPQVVVLDDRMGGPHDAGYLLALSFVRTLPPRAFVLLSDHGSVRLPSPLRPRCVVVSGPAARLTQLPRLLLAAVASAEQRLQGGAEAPAQCPTERPRTAPSPTSSLSPLTGGSAVGAAGIGGSAAPAPPPKPVASV